jgi:hypothetical protein
MQGVLTLAIELWTFGSPRRLLSPRGLPSPHFGNVSLILTLSQNRVTTCDMCHNFSLGLATNARVCKDAGRKWSLRVTFHVHGSVGKCEGMNPNTPKWVPTLGIRVMMNSRIIKWRLQGSKSLDWKIPYTIGKLLKWRCLKWVCMTHLGT